MVGLNLFGWTYVLNGVQEHLRVLDLGDNPGIADEYLDGVAVMKLWEL